MTIMTPRSSTISVLSVACTVTVVGMMLASGDASAGRVQRGWQSTLSSPAPVPAPPPPPAAPAPAAVVPSNPFACFDEVSEQVSTQVRNPSYVAPAPFVTAPPAIVPGRRVQRGTASTPAAAPVVVSSEPEFITVVSSVVTRHERPCATAIPISVPISTLELREVPSPSVFALLGIGGLALWSVRKRSRQA